MFTATAAVKGAGGAAASAPVTITIDRKMSQGEAESLVAAFKTGGAAALRKGLAGTAPLARFALAQAAPRRRASRSSAPPAAAGF